MDGHPVAAFRVTDGNATVKVNYVGILPDLFREGQGVVALGTLQPDGTFRASEVLAKHDETYMPKEVARRAEEVRPLESGGRPAAARLDLGRDGGQTYRGMIAEAGPGRLETCRDSTLPAA